MAIFWLLVGCFACATSVLWIKFSTLEPVLLSGLRLELAALVLAPWAIRDWRRHRDRLDWSHVRDAAIPGVLLALHFITWIYGVRLTLASNGTLIVNLTPLATTFLLAALAGERVSRRETVGTALALVGLAILFFADFRLSGGTLWGDLVCVVAMVLLAAYLTLARRFRHHPTTLLYVTPLYAIAGLVALALAPFTWEGKPITWWDEALWVSLLVLLPTVVGHSLMNGAMRTLRGQVVSVVNMSQFIFAGLMAWPALGERPGAPFYVAAIFVLAAGFVVALGPENSAGDAAENLES